MSHSLSNILSSSTICVDSSNCPSGGGPGVLLCVEDSFIPLAKILGFQITFLRHDSFDRLPFVATTASEIPLASYFSPKDLELGGELRDGKPNTEYQLFRQNPI